MTAFGREVLSLGLDVSTKTGYCLLSSSRGVLDKGVWTHPNEAGDTLRWSLYGKSLGEFLGRHPLPHVCLLEGYAFSGRAYTVVRLAELTSVVKQELLKHGLDTVVVTPSRLKKWATGRGNASKSMMLEESNKTLSGEVVKDDNIADAHALSRLGVALVLGDGSDEVAAIRKDHPHVLFLG